MKSKKILVYGGTGSQGRAVVTALLKNGHQPYVLSRNGEKAKDLEALGSQVVIGDTANKESLVKASTNMDGVALMTPLFTNVLPEVSARNAIEAAQEAKVPFIVYNTSGIARDEKIGNPLLDHQKDTIALLKASGLKYVVLAPSIYTENLFGPYTAPFVAKENKVTYPLPQDMAVNWIATQDMGRLMAIAFDKPELSGKFYKAASPERLNGKELAESFSDGLKRHIHYETMDPQVFGKILDETFGPGAGDAVAKDYQQFHDFPEKRTAFQIETEDLVKDFGLDFTEMSEWVRENKDLFTINKNLKSDEKR